MTAFLGDDLITLRPLTVQDIDGPYAKWFNDPEIVKNNSHGRFPMGLEELKSYVHESQSKFSSYLVLAVMWRESSQHIGNISLQNINWVDRSCEIAFILGELSYQGRGVMFRAASLLISHAFKQLNLRRIYCGTLDTNVAMKGLAIKLGMEQEGRRRAAVYKGGKYIDIVEYGLLSGFN